jgi:cytochrome c-type biogenesis protein CcmH/NrfG
VSTLAPDDLAALEEERRFLRRSLDDLQREHDAGDLDDADLVTLRADYERRLERVQAAIEGGALPAAPRRRLGRTLVVAAVVAVAAVGAGLAVAANAGSRAPGDTITGEVPTTPGQLLQEAARLAQEGEYVSALETYDQVLETNPENVEALAEKGLLLMSLSQAADRPVLRTEARAALDEALAVDPDDPRTLFYLGLWHDLEGDDAAAELRFREALGNDPPPALRRAIEGFMETTEGR